MRRLVALVLAMSAFVTGGCAEFRAASPSRELRVHRPEPLAPEAWPARYAETVLSGGRPPQGVSSVTFRFGRISPDGTEKLHRHRWVLVDRGRIGQMRISEVRLDPTQPRLDIGWDSMLWVHSSKVDPQELAELVKGDEPVELDLGRRGYLTVVRSFPPLSEQTRGLMVHLTGLAGLGPDGTLLRLMREQGWRVVVVTPPGNVIQEVDLLLGGVQLEVAGTGEDELRWVAALVAREVDDRLAEWAYVVEAALVHLRARHPELHEVPRVLSGLSMGAIALPAVAARLADGFDAAVLIAGGANALKILRESSLGLEGPRVVHEHRPLGAQAWERLTRLYLEQTRLDPFAAAGFLDRTPVLVVCATADGIVPVECGELLERRLGYPDRLALPFGHILLHVFLPGQSRRICDWIEASVERGERSRVLLHGRG